MSNEVATEIREEAEKETVEVKIKDPLAAEADDDGKKLDLQFKLKKKSEKEEEDKKKKAGYKKPFMSTLKDSFLDILKAPISRWATIGASIRYFG